MSKQVLGGKDDTYLIKGQLQDFRTMSIFNFECAIQDGVCVVSADDKNFLKKMVKAEQKKGNKNIVYVPVKKLAIEKYPGWSKEDIKEKIVKDLKKAGANITKK